MNKAINREEFKSILRKLIKDSPIQGARSTAKTTPIDSGIPETIKNIQHLQAILAYLDPDPSDHGNRNDWRNQVWAIASLNWKSGRDTALRYSQKGDLYDAKSFNAVWNSYKSNGGITHRNLNFYAKKAGFLGSLDFPDISKTNDELNTRQKSIRTLVTKRADQIKIEPIEWLIEGSFPLGMIGLIAGNPGMGKSQIALKLAALATTGSGSPLKASFKSPGSVIILANEDDAARTIAPRLEAAGAKLDKIEIVEGIARADKEVEPFQIDSDVAALKQKALLMGDVRLIIIDPPNAYIGGKSDTYKDSDVRRILSPLQSLAAETGALVLLIAHLNKRNDAGAHQRINGTTAWLAVSRIGYIVCEDEEDKSRYMVPVKNNIGNDRLGFAYSIKEAILANNIKTSSISWIGTTERTADDLLGSRKKYVPSALDSAKSFLEEELHKGEKLSTELEESAKKVGISWASVCRAKKLLNVSVKKIGNSWRWSIQNSTFKPSPF